MGILGGGIEIEVSLRWRNDEKKGRFEVRGDFRNIDYLIDGYRFENLLGKC